ncbi:MAG: hypothetical protein AAFW89_10245, partial [Bacteroidota bacterium]
KNVKEPLLSIGINIRLSISFITALLVFQVAKPQSRGDSLAYGYLPILSFNTDSRAVFGGEVQRYNYAGRKPFKDYTRGFLMYSTAGAFSTFLSRDQIFEEANNFRLHTEIYAIQNFDNYYLGDTELVSFNEALFDTSDFYNFNSFSTQIGINARFLLKKGEGIHRTDIEAGLRLYYESPWGNREDQFISGNQIEGATGSFLSFIQTGFILERRNSEFRPTKGFLVDVGSRYAPPVLSTHHVIANNVRLNGHIPIPFPLIDVSMAGTIQLQHTYGQTPYWLASGLGGGAFLRGYRFRRFTSDNALSYSIESRSWFFKLPFQNIEIGGNLFMDGGRVFTNSNWDSILRKHNHTFGLGGVMAIFTPDFILKFDLGFSEEGTGLYLGTGYAF